MLLATGVLFYVSYWLISKAQIIKWQHYIKSMVETSLKSESVIALGFAAFLAVYREGAETILFYQALYSGSGGSAEYVLAGFLLGSIALVIIFIFFKYGILKIPLGAFFAVTSTLLYYLAFVFAGKGILELQGAGWLAITPATNFPTVDFLGIYPSWEGIALQLVLILALLAALLYNFLYLPYKEKELLTKDVSHISVDITNLHSDLDHVRQHARSCHQLSKGTNVNEVNEMQGHLKEIDSKVHEVMGHLKTLEVEITDMFSELEETVKGTK
jgi:high-affinity iron transporter